MNKKLLSLSCSLLLCTGVATAGSSWCAVHHPLDSLFGTCISITNNTGEYISISARLLSHHHASVTLKDHQTLALVTNKTAWPTWQKWEKLFNPGFRLIKVQLSSSTGTGLSIPITVKIRNEFGLTCHKMIWRHGITCD